MQHKALTTEAQSLESPCLTYLWLFLWFKGPERSRPGWGNHQGGAEGAGFVGSGGYIQPHRVHRQQQAHVDPHQGLEGCGQPGGHPNNTHTQIQTTQKHGLCRHQNFMQLTYKGRVSRSENKCLSAGWAERRLKGLPCFCIHPDSVSVQVGDNRCLLQSLKDSPYYRSFQDKVRSLARSYEYVL